MKRNEKICNTLLFNKIPAHNVSSDNPISDARLFNFNCIFSKLVILGVFVAVYHLWRHDAYKRFAGVIAFTYTIAYVYLQTRVESRLKNYDTNCSVPLDNPYFQ